MICKQKPVYMHMLKSTIVAISIHFETHSCRTGSMNEEVADVEMTEEVQGIKEEEPKSETVQPQQPAKKLSVQGLPVQEQKQMLSLEDRMKEFRDMMLERGVRIHC